MNEHDYAPEAELPPDYQKSIDSNPTQNDIGNAFIETPEYLKWLEEKSLEN